MTTRLPASIKVDISITLVFLKKSNNNRLKWFNAPRAYTYTFKNVLWFIRHCVLL